MGFLISTPTKMTFFFIKAKDMARFAAIKVFPSPLMVEVANMTGDFMSRKT